MADTDKKQKDTTGKVAQKVKKPLWRRLLKYGLVLGAVGTVSVGVLIVWAIIYYGRDLPDYRQLAQYEPAVVTRVHAGDGLCQSWPARSGRLLG